MMQNANVCSFGQAQGFPTHRFLRVGSFSSFRLEVCSPPSWNSACFLAGGGGGSFFGAWHRRGCKDDVKIRSFFTSKNGWLLGSIGRCRKCQPLGQVSPQSGTRTYAFSVFDPSEAEPSCFVLFILHTKQASSVEANYLYIYIYTWGSTMFNY